jgi:hypothetical protein
MAARKKAETTIHEAQYPSDIFGKLSNKPGTKTKLVEHIKGIYRALSLKVHPDHCTSKDAEALFGKLTSMKDAAIAYVTGEVAPTKRDDGVLFKPITFSTSRGSYSLFRGLATGGTCLIYEAIFTPKTGDSINAIARVVRSPKDNDLMQREAKVFSALAAKLKTLTPDAAKGIMARFPKFIEAVKVAADKGGHRVVNVFGRDAGMEKGWFTLEQIRKQYPNGVPPQSAGFIMNRILECLHFANHCGIAHGAITPNHVVIHTDSHTGNLIDWTAATTADNRTVPYMEDRYIAYYAPETQATKVATGATDIYMAGWCLVYVLGGSPETRELPIDVPGPIRDFINKCVQPKPRNRPKLNTAFEEFRQVLKSVYGPPRFVELPMRQETK